MWVTAYDADADDVNFRLGSGMGLWLSPDKMAYRLING
jgi:hypothetical protein